MNKIDKKRFDLLKELTTTHGISGYESLIKKIIKTKLKILIKLLKIISVILLLNIIPIKNRQLCLLLIWMS